MIPFAFWWFATTRDILPSRFGAANVRCRLNVVAQSGCYAPGETDLRKFIVEGEQCYWMHVAIDRFTGRFSMSGSRPERVARGESIVDPHSPSYSATGMRWITRLEH